MRLCSVGELDPLLASALPCCVTVYVPFPLYALVSFCVNGRD